MYTHKRFTISVRDGGRRYGGHAPTPSEDYPGARVLQDLSRAQPDETPSILARYAALRAWSLRQNGSPVPLLDHALRAAREHLNATPPEWPERRLLQQALDSTEGAKASRLLESAAQCAEAVGHPHGARALREAVHRVRWRAGDYPPQSSS